MSVLCPMTRMDCHREGCSASGECEGTGEKTLAKITISAMRLEAEREVAMRKQVYPGRVANKKMSADCAAFHLSTMEAIVKFLAWCEPRAEQLRKLKKDTEAND